MPPSKQVSRKGGSEAKQYHLSRSGYVSLLLVGRRLTEYTREPSLVHSDVLLPLLGILSTAIDCEIQEMKHGTPRKA